MTIYEYYTWHLNIMTFIIFTLLPLRPASHRECRVACICPAPITGRRRIISGYSIDDFKSRRLPASSGEYNGYVLCTGVVTDENATMQGRRGGLTSDLSLAAPGKRGDDKKKGCR